jgi:glycosyltransferase involved in cell wall biosynthesis
MTGENIICFAKDWSEDPTSNNHVMRMLARENRVLWLNSISMRTPNFASGRDLGKIGKKLASFAQGARKVTENLWVYTPIVLPFPHSALAHALNRQLLRFTLGLLRRRMGMKQFQLWTFLPNAVEYVGTLGESLAVYYCIDEWSHFSYLDGRKMAAMEEELCRRSDIVFATAHSLAEAKRPYNPETQLALHGVDFEHFSRALDPATKVADDIAALPQPVLGFFGLIHEWIDLKLIGYLAERHPEWSIAMIGKTCVDVSALERFPNVHFLGRKPYEELPKYCKGMSVGLVPFAVNELTLHVNPIKLREYLSAGLPVVSTALPEVGFYREHCEVAESYEAFEKGVAAVLARDTPEFRQARSNSMRSETWERKVADLMAHVARVKARKAAPSSKLQAPSSEPGARAPSPATGPRGWESLEPGAGTERS